MNAQLGTQPGRCRLFGIPLDDFGLFSSVLMSFSVGFLCFFAATFLAIVTILIYNSGAHAAINFADSYRLVGLPVGVAALLLSLAFFGTLWARRRISEK